MKSPSESAPGPHPYAPEDAVALRKFLADSPDVPWCYQAIVWLCEYRARTKDPDTLAAERDAQLILARPDTAQAVEAVARVVALGMVGQFQATWLVARYARDNPKGWKQLTETLRKEFPKSRAMTDFVAAVQRTGKALPQLTDPKTGLDPRTAKLAEALAGWIALLENDQPKTALLRWAKDEAVDQSLTKTWARLRRLHKHYDYRSWIDSTMGRNSVSAKGIGDAKKFTVGGHDFGYAHIDWQKTTVGWRIARVWTCR